MKLLASLTLLLILSIQSSFAFFAGYTGIGVGAINTKVKTNASNLSSYSPSASFILGVESNHLLLIKFGLEGFVDQAILLNAENRIIDYTNPMHYGVKGKLMFNLIFFDTYLALGLGREAGRVKSNFTLGGLGVQAKILNFGAFAEINYLETVKKSNIKTSRLALQVGLKYYFL